LSLWNDIKTILLTFISFYFFSSTKPFTLITFIFPQEIVLTKPLSLHTFS